MELRGYGQPFKGEGRRRRDGGGRRGGRAYTSPEARQREIAEAEAKKNFGNGEVRGDNSWTSPVYGNTEDGQDVTVSFGQGSREGHTGISSGHVEMGEYYGQGGHDHYGRDGESHRDSGRYRE